MFQKVGHGFELVTALLSAPVLVELTTHCAIAPQYCVLGFRLISALHIPFLGVEESHEGVLHRPMLSNTWSGKQHW